MGSLKNKLLILLPAALALSLFAPWAITPLLMLGGAYLCYEGAEKVLEARPAARGARPTPPSAPPTAEDPRRRRSAEVRGAIRTDLILSAEIMAITLATVAEAARSGPRSSSWPSSASASRPLVYGAVALIVKADDVGVALARRSSACRRARLGRLIVRGMPPFLKLLGLVGTAAMLWVGGGIIAARARAVRLCSPGPPHRARRRARRPRHRGRRPGGRLAHGAAAAAGV